MTMRPQHNHAPQPARATRGFTLIEIMIVVALIGILASIALSSYQSHARKTRRYAAQSCLMEQAQYLERYYTTAKNPMSYADAVLPNATCKSNLASYYVFSLPAALNSSQAFSVQAAATGGQTGDTSCLTMALNQSALQSSSSATGATTGCWP